MAEKKKDKKQKKMMPMSPRPTPRPERLDDPEAGRAVERGNRAARRFADEYDSLMNYRDGGMVRGCGPAQTSGKAFKGTF